MGDLVGAADGQQHMAGVQRTGGAGAAGGRTDPGLIQQQQQAFALNALKAEVHVAGEPVDGIAVQGAVGNLRETGDKLVPQCGDLGGVFVDVIAGLLQRSGQTHDAGNVFRTGPLAPLLGAALDDVGQGDALPGIQHAGTLGTMEFMAGEGQHIDVLLLHIDVEVAGGLHGVGVEQDTLFMAHGADLGDGQDGADLVIGVHDGHQAGVGPDGVSHLLGGDGAGGAHRQQLHLKALLLQLFQGVENGVVLEGGGDDVLLALALTDAGGGDQSLIVGLAAAGGKGDLTGCAAQTGGHGLPGAL